MFGYVKPSVGELLVKEHEFYKATYCGICRSMKKHTGALSTVTITYDSVFLAMIRMAYMDDSELASKMGRCALHPIKKRCMLTDNSAIEYTARAFAVLTYYKMMDDLSDEKILRKMLVNMTRPIVSHAKNKAKMDELADIVRDKLSAITELERAKCPSIDEPAELFGELLGEIFAGGLEDEKRLVSYQCGYHLGRFIYAADAAEDYGKDLACGRYNPYCIAYGEKELSDENKASIKRALIWECRQLESAINLVPFGKKRTIENIIKNIIYVGLIKRISFLDNTDG